MGLFWPGCSSSWSGRSPLGFWPGHPDDFGFAPRQVVDADPKDGMTRECASQQARRVAGLGGCSSWLSAFRHGRLGRAWDEGQGRDDECTHRTDQPDFSSPPGFSIGQCRLSHRHEDALPLHARRARLPFCSGACCALLTAATAGVPPFLLTALTFAIGGGLGLIVLISTGQLARLRQPAGGWALGVRRAVRLSRGYFAAR